MPPRRAAATKAAAATAPAAKPAAKSKPATKAKAAGSKRKKEEVSDVEEGEGEEDDGGAAPAPAKKAKRGTAKVDDLSGKASDHVVYVDKDGEIYDATLNQTNITNNNNKFYIVQLLHPKKSSASCILFTRWGRVGENGSTQFKGPLPSEVAEKAFKDQFKSKSGIAFEQRMTATAKANKYTWIDMQYDGEEEDEATGGTAAPKVREATPDSLLEKPVKDIVDFIFNQAYINAHLSFFNYDSNKLPLGKLSKDTVKRGYAALKDIADELGSGVKDEPDVKEEEDEDTKPATGRGRRAAAPKAKAKAKVPSEKILTELTNKYYSIIPHSFGRSKPTVINTQALLKQETDLIETLAELESTNDIVGVKKEAKKENLTDSNLKSLNLDEIKAVDHASDEFTNLERYCSETYKYGNYAQPFKLEEIFRIERNGERERWVENGWDDLKDIDGGSRLLLFHGSRSSNFGGILRNGLKIAPPEAPHNGYLYGKGLYFADMLKLSACYTCSGMSDNTGLVLLCEVAAKPFLHRLQNTHHAAEECKAAEKSLFKTQATDHDAWEDAGKATGNEKLNGVLMPQVANLKTRSEKESWWHDNMFVAYDVSQVRIRYLLRMKFGH